MTVKVITTIERTDGEIKFHLNIEDEKSTDEDEKAVAQYLASVFVKGMNQLNKTLNGEHHDN